MKWEFISILSLSGALLASPSVFGEPKTEPQVLGVSVKTLQNIVKTTEMIAKGEVDPNNPPADGTGVPPPPPPPPPPPQGDKPSKKTANNDKPPSAQHVPGSKPQTNIVVYPGGIDPNSVTLKKVQYSGGKLEKPWEKLTDGEKREKMRYIKENNLPLPEGVTFLDEIKYAPKKLNKVTTPASGSGGKPGAPEATDATQTNDIVLAEGSVALSDSELEMVRYLQKKFCRIKPKEKNVPTNTKNIAGNDNALQGLSEQMSAQDKQAREQKVEKIIGDSKKDEQKAADGTITTYKHPDGYQITVTVSDSIKDVDKENTTIEVIFPNGAKATSSLGGLITVVKSNEIADDEHIKALKQLKIQVSGLEEKLGADTLKALNNSIKDLTEKWDPDDNDGDGYFDLSEGQLEGHKETLEALKEKLDAEKDKDLIAALQGRIDWIDDALEDEDMHK